jgi:hypothetical protein
MTARQLQTQLATHAKLRRVNSTQRKAWRNNPLCCARLRYEWVLFYGFRSAKSGFSTSGSHKVVHQTHMDRNNPKQHYFLNAFDFNHPDLLG